MTSLGKGIAFVRFESEEAAQAALAAHETQLEGSKRKLRVETLPLLALLQPFCQRLTPFLVVPQVFRASAKAEFAKRKANEAAGRNVSSAARLLLPLRSVPLGSPAG